MTFSNVDATLLRLRNTAENIGDILQMNLETVPYAVLPDFVGTITTVKDSIRRSDNAVVEFCSRAFSGATSPNFIHDTRRFFMSKSLQAVLTSIQRVTGEAESTLHNLPVQLCATLKMDEAALIPCQNWRSAIEKHLYAEERYRPAFNTPILQEKLLLDFKSRDGEGNLVFLEADVKSAVFISTSPQPVTVVRGVSSPGRENLPVHGVSGMPGVGKTIAIMGLGHDDEIKAHFADGVLCSGAKATAGDLTNNLAAIMRAAGSVRDAAEVEPSSTLVDAFESVTQWFQGKEILLLLDEIWPSSSRIQEYMLEQEGLLQGSPPLVVKAHQCLSGDDCRICSGSLDGTENSSQVQRIHGASCERKRCNSGLEAGLRSSMEGSEIEPRLRL